MQSTIKVIGTKKFKSRVVRETAYGVIHDYGEMNNTMTLQRVGNDLMIEWAVGNGDDYANIGIFTVGKDVIDYDGVFELPKEAIQLLNECGFNTQEVQIK